MANPGEVLPTGKPEGVACADAILSVYLDNKGTAGLPAFSGYDYRRREPTYAWAVQLQAGYSPAEISLLAKDAITEALAAKLGLSERTLYRRLKNL